MHLINKNANQPTLTSASENQTSVLS